MKTKAAQRGLVCASVCKINNTTHAAELLNRDFELLHFLKRAWVKYLLLLCSSIYCIVCAAVPQNKNKTKATERELLVTM